jgi:hypothetical protein
MIDRIRLFDRKLIQSPQSFIIKLGSFGAIPYRISRIHIIQSIQHVPAEPPDEALPLYCNGRVRSFTIVPRFGAREGMGVFS